MNPYDLDAIADSQDFLRDRENAAREDARSDWDGYDDPWENTPGPEDLDGHAALVQPISRAEVAKSHARWEDDKRAGEFR